MPPPATCARSATVPPAPALGRALALAALGVAVFGLTIPMTRIAVGTPASPQLSPFFVTVGRAAVAGLLAAVYLVAVRAPWPSAAQWRAALGTMLGVVFGFPLCLALAVRRVPAAHAAVVTGLLPLATALLGAWWLGQRPGRAAWACLGLGCALVLAYALQQGGGALQAADLLLLAAVFSAASGYILGARLSAAMGAPRAISWTLVLALPLTLALSAWSWPAPATWAVLRPAAWAAFAYVSVASMWLGFFAWYRALAAGARVPGGLLKVSQVQLLQPFVSLLAAWPLLGEPMTPASLAFALAVLATVAAGQRLRATDPPTRPEPPPSNRPPME